jgi:hypothetical protein
MARSAKNHTFLSFPRKRESRLELIRRFLKHDVQLAFQIAFTVALLVPHRAQCQVTRLDSIVAMSVAGAIDSLDRGNVTVAGDSSFLPLIKAMPVSSGSGVPSAGSGQALARQLATFYIDQLDATVTSTDSPSLLHILLHGSLIRPGNPVAEQHSWNFSNPIALTEADRSALIINTDRYVHLDRAAPRSLWDSTIEPALVVLGAAAIVALFFLIHS